MQETVNSYIEHMRAKYGVTAAMIAGSYATGRMGPNSDVDLFFIWERDYEAARGRESFAGVEFEYFISPEWKYYDRMRTDRVSVRIYGTAMIVWDPEGRLARIADVARAKAGERGSELGETQVRDYKFWLETIRRDGEDLFDAGRYADFAYFAATNIERLTNLLEILAHSGPVYSKYGVEEASAIDATYGRLLSGFLLAPPGSPAARQGWVHICCYLDGKLAPLDISSYHSSQRL